MPMNRDPQKGGKEADGSRNSKYCSYCYVDGAFVQPEMTANEMKILVNGKMIEMGFPKFLSGFSQRGSLILKDGNHN